MEHGVDGVWAAAVLVAWWAVVWEKNSGGLEPEAQARVEAVQRRSASAADGVRQRLGAATHVMHPAGFSQARAKRLESKARASQ